MFKRNNPGGCTSDSCECITPDCACLDSGGTLQSNSSFRVDIALTPANVSPHTTPLPGNLSASYVLTLPGESLEGTEQCSDIIVVEAEGAESAPDVNLSTYINSYSLTLELPIPTYSLNQYGVNVLMQYQTVEYPAFGPPVQIGGGSYSQGFNITSSISGNGTTANGCLTSGDTLTPQLALQSDSPAHFDVVINSLSVEVV